MHLASYHIANMQGIGSRERQEDSFGYLNACDVKAIRERGLYFAVCDGMGGMKDGRIASESAVQYIFGQLSHMDLQKNIAAQLKQYVYESSAVVEEKLEGQGGSTAVACLIYQDALYFASVGDSFLYLKRGEELIRLNTEHNLCTRMYKEAIESGELDPEPPRVHPESHALTAFLGMPGLAEMDGSVKPYPIKEGDVILACSDGVGGVLSEGEVLTALSYKEPEAMCEAIKLGVLAHQKPNQDNFTAVVVKCVR